MKEYHHIYREAKDIDIVLSPLIQTRVTLTIITHPPRVMLQLAHSYEIIASRT